ncbi:MAG: Hypothetical protein BHV28_02790 [Candidatus Tokpelaia hoelldobleri]|uniref:Lipoprotein n=1 Tax=Candidatus Tokpelaia hoelldobleri TaxID=1902579 RepID=A0A1U9JT08_9HYPH|nr:MAG: Hypothetical protein BHV28_02790 [Candidatus Tokpelaia hoelldoblerii]
MNRQFSSYILLAGLVLQGCQTKSITEMSYPEQMKLAEVIKNKCVGYGLKVDSLQFRQCFEQEVRAEELGRLRRRQAWQNFSEQQDRLAVARESARQPSSCTSTVWGSTVRTNCW